MAGRKRPSTVSKHRVEYNASWTADFLGICLSMMLMARIQSSVCCVPCASNTIQSNGIMLEHGQKNLVVFLGGTCYNATRSPRCIGKLK
jgi:hypothetical protein